MRIRLTENQILRSPVYEEGKIVRHDERHIAIRSWDVEIEESEIGGALRSALTEFSGEVRWLIELAANKIR